MPVPVDFYEATFILKANAATRESTCAIGCVDLSVGGPRSAADMADDLYGMITALNSPFDNASMMDDYVFKGVSVAFGTVGGDIIGQKLLDLTGTVNDACPPINCALLVSKATASGGRRNRGRLFVPPCQINEGAVNEVGQVSGATLSTATNQWNNVVTGAAAIDVGLVLFHQGIGAPAPTAITALTVQSQLATQRRRMRN